MHGADIDFDRSDRKSAPYVQKGQKGGRRGNQKFKNGNTNGLKSNVNVNGSKKKTKSKKKKSGKKKSANVPRLENGDGDASGTSEETVKSPGSDNSEQANTNRSWRRKSSSSRTSSSSSELRSDENRDASSAPTSPEVAEKKPWRDDESDKDMSPSVATMDKGLETPDEAKEEQTTTATTTTEEQTATTEEQTATAIVTAEDQTTAAIVTTEEQATTPAVTTTPTVAAEEM